MDIGMYCGRGERVEDKVTLCLVATHYRANNTGIATLVIEIRVSDAEAAAADTANKGISKGDLVAYLGHAISKNEHLDPKKQQGIASLFAAYAAKTDNWQLMKLLNNNALWMKLLSTGRGKGLRSKTRMVGSGMEEEFVAQMERVRALEHRLPKDELETYVISRRLEDIHITGDAVAA